MTKNPLLNFEALPYFSSIQAEHVLPALKTVLSESRVAVR